MSIQNIQTPLNFKGTCSEALKEHIGEEFDLTPQSQSTTEDSTNGNPWMGLSSRYRLKTLLGSGSWGSVMEADDTVTGKPVAIKLIRDFMRTDYTCLNVLREVKILRELNKLQQHASFVPRLIDIIIKDDESDAGKQDIFLVMTSMQLDLRELLNSGAKLSGAHIKVLVYNLLCCVRFLHSANILHRDIKPENILVNEKC